MRVKSEGGVEARSMGGSSSTRFIHANIHHLHDETHEEQRILQIPIVKRVTDRMKQSQR